MLRVIRCLHWSGPWIHFLTGCSWVRVWHLTAAHCSRAGSASGKESRFVSLSHSIFTAGSVFLAGGADWCQVTGGLWVQSQQEVPAPVMSKYTCCYQTYISGIKVRRHFKRHCVLFCFCMHVCVWLYVQGFVLGSSRVSSSVELELDTVFPLFTCPPPHWHHQEDCGQRSVSMKSFE